MIAPLSKMSRREFLVAGGVAAAGCLLPKRMLAQNQVEVKVRRTGETIAIDKDKVKETILELCQ